MTFTLTATSVWDAPNADPNGTKITEAEFGLLLTDGLELLSLGWSGQTLRPGTTSYSRSTTFKARQPQQVVIQVKLRDAGFHIVDGGASVSSKSSSFVNAANRTFYLNVTSERTLIQPLRFPNNLLHQHPHPSIKEQHHATPTSSLHCTSSPQSGACQLALARSQYLCSDKQTFTVSTHIERVLATHADG